MRTVFSSETDVVGPMYRRLIEGLIAECPAFTLVWQNARRFDDSAMLVATDLHHLEVSRHQAARWPGTELRGSTATVVRFRSDTSAVPVLLRPTALFSWQPPAYPEDLAFYDHDGTAVFASVAHESLLWVMSPKLKMRLPETLELAEEPCDESTWRNLIGVA